MASLRKGPSHTQKTVGILAPMDERAGLYLCTVKLYGICWPLWHRDFGFQSGGHQPVLKDPNGHVDGKNRGSQEVFC